MKHLIFILLIVSASSTYAQQLKPFTTDGCSTFPDGTLAQQSLWIKCCIHHDFAYWKGGTYKERLISDKALRTCVTAAGEPHIAELMLAGVRVGGSPYLPTPYRWGYGWTYFRGYKPLTTEELLDVKKKFIEFKSIIDGLNKDPN